MQKKKKNILFLGYGNNDWVGGLYYIKNVIGTLMCSKIYTENFTSIIVTDKNNKGLFQDLEGVKVVEFNCKSRKQEHIANLISALRFNPSYMFPIAADNKLWNHNNPFSGWLKKHGICWIPDFQHVYLPDNFPKQEIENRNLAYQNVAYKSELVVVSSNTAKKDYLSHFDVDEKKIIVLPFISKIDSEINGLDVEFCINVLRKYELIQKKYIYIPNQFWKHKNHIIVLKMIKYAEEQETLRDVQFVFTGNIHDTRNKNHIDYLNDYIRSNKIENRIKVLGFLPRMEQLAIMKMAELIIQPSLFEGWGTVLEDCKCLQKKVILSDLDIHKEQKNNMCTLFKANDEVDLYFKIKKELEKEEITIVENIQERAEGYSKEFVEKSLAHLRGGIE